MDDQTFIRHLVEKNRYLSLATAADDAPWVAPLEYIADAQLNIYFFSPENAKHSEHIARSPRVAFAIFDHLQPDYEPAPVMRISGLQASATATRIKAPFPALVEAQINAWKLPMPPYHVFRLVADKWFIPVLEDGANKRLAVEMN